MSETTTSEKVLTFKEKTVLEQMRQHHRDTVAEFGILDSKALAIVSVSSIIITIITGFKLVGANSVNSWPVLICYLLTLGTALWVLRTQETAHEPIKANWDDIRDTLNTEDADFFYKLLSGYELSIGRNLEVNDRKATFVNIAFALLGVTVIVALLTAMA